jgi:hypothetical protein
MILKIIKRLAILNLNETASLMKILGLINVNE